MTGKTTISLQYKGTKAQLIAHWRERAAQLRLTKSPRKYEVRACHERAGELEFCADQLENFEEVRGGK